YASPKASGVGSRINLRKVPGAWTTTVNAGGPAPNATTVPSHSRKAKSARTVAKTCRRTSPARAERRGASTRGIMGELALIVGARPAVSRRLSPLGQEAVEVIGEALIQRSLRM